MAAPALGEALQMVGRDGYDPASPQGALRAARLSERWQRQAEQGANVVPGQLGLPGLGPGWPNHGSGREDEGLERG